MKAFLQQVAVLALSAMIGVGSTFLYTWRKVSNLEIELHDVRMQQDTANQRIDHQQMDINTMYTIGGKLDQLIGEVHEMRADLRAGK